MRLVKDIKRQPRMETRTVFLILFVLTAAMALFAHYVLIKAY